MCMGGGSNAGVAARRAEEARQERIKEGMADIDNRFAGFDDTYYNNRRQVFLDYALPQVATQFRGAQSSLVAALARRGLLNSSVGAKQLADLTQERDLHLANMQNRAQGFVNDERARVGKEKQNLIGLLNASADPAASANLSATAANALQSAPSFSPIGQLFANSTALAAANAANVARGSDSIFRRSTGPSGGSSLKVVG